MDTRTMNELKTRAFEELREILENGDRPYLLSLSRTDLVTALENELYFLGLYSAGNSEARAFLHTLIEANVVQWRAALAAFAAPIAQAH